jgi:hypothetical protein
LIARRAIEGYIHLRPRELKGNSGSYPLSLGWLSFTDSDAEQVREYISYALFTITIAGYIVF